MRGTSYFSAFSALFRPLAQLSQQGQGFGIIPLGRALQPEGGLRGAELDAKLREGICAKPMRHHLSPASPSESLRGMSRIGG